MTYYFAKLSSFRQNVYHQLNYCFTKLWCFSKKLQNKKVNILRKKETYVNENMAMPCLDYLWNENNKIWINPQPYTWREIDFKYEV